MSLEFAAMLKNLWLVGRVSPLRAVYSETNPTSAGF
jgi:hypothetical protein